jgi:hypothetical protein
MALLDIPLEQLARFSGNAWTDGCVMLFNVQHYIQADFVWTAGGERRRADKCRFNAVAPATFDDGVNAGAALAGIGIPDK